MDSVCAPVELPKRGACRHNGPTWNRLSGWCGSPERARLVLRAYDGNDDASLVGLKDFCSDHNVHEVLVALLIRTYKLKPKVSNPRLFSEAELLDLLESKGPPPGSLSSTQAASHVSEKYFPTPVWQLAQLRYFDKQAVEAAKYRFVVKRGRRCYQPKSTKSANDLDKS